MGYTHRTMETKMSILEMLATKSKTLTDISRELGLSPSTVSQHLKELRMAGAIQQVYAGRPRKWKLYTVTSNYWTSRRDNSNEVDPWALGNYGITQR